MDSQSTEFLPAAYLLFGLALASLIGVLVPRLRNLWHWGRTVDSVPISRLGCLLAFVGFVVMGAAPAGLAWGRLSGSVAILVLLGGFIFFILAGALDSWKARRS
jgi:hypothetical protein